MAVLSESYRQENDRTWLALPEELAPIKACVSPLLRNKPELVEKAREVFDIVRKNYQTVVWDDSGNIGKRYARQDEIGTPRCFVIDFETLENNSVTVRDRDTAEQSRVSVNEL